MNKENNMISQMIKRMIVEGKFSEKESDQVNQNIQERFWIMNKTTFIGWIIVICCSIFFSYNYLGFTITFLLLFISGIFVVKKRGKKNDKIQSMWSNCK